MIDFVTVVFKEELTFLEIQARSIELYVNPENLNSIIIIVNDDSSVIDLIDLTWYGQYRSRVKIIHYSDFFEFIPLCTGWNTQQLCKIYGASISTVDWCIALDAKTWFIQPLDLSTIFTSDNKVYANPMECSPYFYGARDFVQSFLNVDLNNSYLEPAGVPFYFHVDTVKSMIYNIGLLHRNNFTDFFKTYILNPPRLTEFILYSGYVLYKFGNYDTLYQSYTPMQHQNYNYVNVSDWEANVFDEKMYAIHSLSKILTISLHKRTYPLITEEQYNKWIELIVDKHLINSVENAKIKLNTFRTGELPC